VSLVGEYWEGFEGGSTVALYRMDDTAIDRPVRIS